MNQNRPSSFLQPGLHIVSTISPWLLRRRQWLGVFYFSAAAYGWLSVNSFYLSRNNHRLFMFYIFYSEIHVLWWYRDKFVKYYFYRTVGAAVSLSDKGITDLEISRFIEIHRNVVTYIEIQFYCQQSRSKDNLRMGLKLEFAGSKPASRHFLTNKNFSEKHCRQKFKNI